MYAFSAYANAPNTKRSVSVRRNRQRAAPPPPTGRAKRAYLRTSSDKSKTEYVRAPQPPSVISVITLTSMTLFSQLVMLSVSIGGAFLSQIVMLAREKLMPISWGNVMVDPCPPPLPEPRGAWSMTV